MLDARPVRDKNQLRDVGGYDTSYNTHEDYEMWLHLATNGRRMVFVPAVLGYYYILPESKTASLSPEANTAWCAFSASSTRSKCVNFEKYEHFPDTLPPRRRQHPIPKR